MGCEDMNVNKKTNIQANFMHEKANEMIQQFANKNIAYGDSFGKQFAKYGTISALVRINDKFSRIESLILGAENNVQDEKLEDTLTDMACYRLMTLYEITKGDTHLNENPKIEQYSFENDKELYYFYDNFFNILRGDNNGKDKNNMQKKDAEGTNRLP